MKSMVFFYLHNCYYEKIGNGTPIKLEDLPFDIPDSWTWIRLKNLGTIQTGKKDANFGSSIGRYCFFTCAKLPIKCNSYSFEGESILLAGNGDIGNISLYEGKFEAYQRTYIIQPLIEHLYTNWIYNHLLSNWVKYNKDKMFGSAIPYIRLGNVEEYYVALPPINEQRKIINKINTFEPLLKDYEKAESNLSLLETEFSDKLKKSILQYAIEGKLVKQDPNDEPASVLLERIKTEKERLIREGKIKRDKNESVIFQGDDKNYYENLSNNWSYCSLGFISKAIGDGIHGTPKFSESGEYYFVNGSNLLNGTISLKGTKKCNKIEYIKYKKPLDEATILLSINGTLGNLSFYRSEPIILGKSAAFISLIDREMLLWVSLFLKSSIAWKHFKSKLTGTTIKNIPLSAIRSLQISIPPLLEQCRIMQKYTKTIKLIE